MKNQLKLKINEEGNRVIWECEGTSLANREEADFWRLMADDGYYMEMQIKSSQQKGTVERNGNVTVIKYYPLVTDNGRLLDFGLTLTVTETDDRIIFDSEIVNHDKKARANELEYPYIELTKLCGEPEDDVLIRPNGVGERIIHPWTALEADHTEYMSADYYDIKSTLTYPRPASMSWFGVETGGKFLYLGRHDERTKACCLLNSIAPRGAKTKYLASAVCQYPFVRKDETVKNSPVIVTLAEGDWRVGSDIYGEFARSTFYHPVTPREWVKNMTGWQRIILRHQFGEIFWKYSDLPRLYLEGKKCGLDTLLVFGWWKGRFDNGYPHYEPDDELGGAEGLSAAIAEVKRLGGNVILYNNGILIDKNTDFYRNHHNEAARIDIDGNEYEDHYKFENNGTVLRNFGYKSFVRSCQATKIWHDTLVSNGRQMLSFNPDSVFYDQIGSSSKLCFNPEHEHGYRPDDEMVYRRRNLSDLRDLLGDDQALGTECTNDAVCGEVDYLHGSDIGTIYRNCKGAATDRLFPRLFRRTFPEIIISNRRLHDCREGYRQDLNYAFIVGFRYDVAIYRSRKAIITDLPEYADYTARLLALKEKYHKYFYGDGKFVCETDLTLPTGVSYTEYLSPDGRMFALWNEGDKAKEITVTYAGVTKTVTLGSDEVDCIEFPKSRV